MQKPPDGFLERIIALYDEGVLTENTRETLAAWSVHLSTLETIDSALLRSLLMWLICDKHRPTRERAGQSLIGIDKEIRQSIYQELANNPDEWSRACAVMTLGFWYESDERIRIHRYDSSFVVRYFADQALEAYQRRCALEEQVQRFRSGDNLQRLNAYLILRKNGDEYVMHRLNAVIQQHDSAAIFINRLFDDINDSLRKNLKKRAEEEAKVFEASTTIWFD